MIKLAKAYLGNEELCEVKEAFDYGYFGLAYKVSEFERAVGEYLQTEHVVAVNTGTSALHLALDAIGLRDGDEVIVPSLTFVASYQAISATGATPISCEVYPDTLLMDIEDVKKRITDKTKVIMPVHYGGSVCDMKELMKIHDHYGIRIVEDAAHAFGSTSGDHLVGSSGDITCFSFDSIKVMTCGEGGAIVCKDHHLADLLRQKRLLGINRNSYATDWRERGWFYEVSTQGYRYHMSNINAGIGLAQLKKMPDFLQRRRVICEKYNDAFQKLNWIVPRTAQYDSIAPFLYTILVKKDLRDSLMDHLKTNQIESGVSYIPNHIQPIYKRNDVSLPITEQLFREILCLPLHYGLTDDEVDHVINTIINFNRGE